MERTVGQGLVGGDNQLATSPDPCDRRRHVLGSSRSIPRQATKYLFVKHMEPQEPVCCSRRRVGSNFLARPPTVPYVTMSGKDHGSTVLCVREGGKGWKRLQYLDVGRVGGWDLGGTPICNRGADSGRFHKPSTSQ